MTEKDIEKLIFKYKNKGILPDSNILLVYFIGSYNDNLISSFKRTKTFTIEDFKTLSKIISFFGKVYTTPNILTEVGNLSNQLPEKTKIKYYDEFKNYVSLLNENYFESKVICNTSHFNKYGLTDSSIIELSQKKYLVLTDDFRLSNYLNTVGIDVINFNHIRMINW